MKELHSDFVELSTKLARYEQRLVRQEQSNQSLEKRLKDELDRKVAIKSLEKSLDSIRFSLASQIALVMEELQELQAIRGEKGGEIKSTTTKTKGASADLQTQEKQNGLELHKQNQNRNFEIICLELESRLNIMESINSFAGFFSWRILNFQQFKEHGTVVERNGILTSWFGFECRLSLYWTDRRNNATLCFEVVKKTLRTVSYLPFFCDVIVSVISFDGEVMSHKITYENLTHLTPVDHQTSQVLCYAEVADFLQFPKNNRFIVDDQLCIFGYFKPFDPTDGK